MWNTSSYWQIYFSSVALLCYVKIKLKKIKVTDFSCMSVKIISIAIFDNFNLQIVILLLFSSFFYNVCNFSFVCKCVIKCCWGKKKSKLLATLLSRVEERANHSSTPHIWRVCTWTNCMVPWGYRPTIGDKITRDTWRASETFYRIRKGGSEVFFNPPTYYCTSYL